MFFLTFNIDGVIKEVSSQNKIAYKYTFRTQWYTNLLTPYMFSAHLKGRSHITLHCFAMSTDNQEVEHLQRRYSRISECNEAHQ